MSDTHEHHPATTEATTVTTTTTPTETVPKQVEDLSKKREDRGKRLDERETRRETHQPQKESDEDKKSKSKTEAGQHYYNSEVKLPQRTGKSIDHALDAMTRTYLQGGEVRRMAWARPILPFLSGIGAGVLKPMGNIFGGLWYGAAVTGILSPATSLIRRITGENAFSQFARFANRAEDHGIASRIIHGGESRAVKAFYLQEDRDVRQLLRLKDQDVDLTTVGIGSRDRLESLIASGVMAGMKAQMIAEHNVQLSEKDNAKISRLQEAYLMAKNLMEAKIPTQGQQEIFINDVLPNLVRKKERELWMKQTAGITGVGVLKSSAMVILGNVFTFTNINGLLGHLGDAAGRVWKGWTNLTNDWIKPNFINGMQIPSNIQAWMGEWGKNAQSWIDFYLKQGAYAPAAVAGGAVVPPVPAPPAAPPPEVIPTAPAPPVVAKLNPDIVTKVNIIRK